MREQLKKRIDKLENKKLEKIREGPTDKEVIAQINEQIVDLEEERDRITGYVIVREERMGLFYWLFEWLFNIDITGYAVAEVSFNETNTTYVVIEEPVSSVIVEFITEGPVSEETNISANTKRIFVSSDVHYEDIEEEDDWDY